MHLSCRKCVFRMSAKTTKIVTYSFSQTELSEIIQAPFPYFLRICLVKA